MDFFQNRYHRINAILLIFIGQWPYQSSKWQRLQQIIVHLSIISVLLVQGIKMYEMRSDVDVLIECCAFMGTKVASIGKSFNAMLNCHNMKNLLEEMKRDWSSLTNEQEIKILEKYAEDGRKLSKFYAIFLFGSMTMFLLIPLAPQILDIVLPLNESRQRESLLRTEYYFIDNESHYYTILLHTYSGTILGIWTIVAADAMFVAYVHHICGMLAIVGYRFERIAENVSLKFDAIPAVEDDVNYQELMNCIKIHQNAIKYRTFAVLIESSFSKSFLFLLGVSMSLISISLLQLLTAFGQYEEMYRLIQFISAQMFHLFFNSWAGQKLINQSVVFRDSVYATGWYAVSLRTRSLLKIVMVNGTSTLKITASKFYDMSMENFGQVVQTSISYFTVLASLR